ncbi:MAG: glycosyltransferase family 2 protein [Hespellia sp.]|nr:glycosyltransferase family 2 protein [Hespellia sp.]
MKIITVIIPCFNEQDVLPIFYQKMNLIMKQVKRVVVELIFVDDGSTDSTLQILKDLSKQDLRCKYISFSRNFGKEAAIYAGLKESQGDYVAIMDADLQDPPEYLPQMYQILESEEYDCVGTRRANRKGEKRIRSFLSSSFYKVINKISKTGIVEGARDYRMMTRKMVDALLQLGECNRFSKGMFSWVGFRTKWLEYENVKRAAGETKWSMRKLFKYSLDGIMGFSTMPLSIASYGGILFCLISFFCIAILVVKNIFWHDPVAGWPALMCVILFLGGVQLLCMGILGQYLARTYIEVKNRPVYLIKEVSDETIKEKKLILHEPDDSTNSDYHVQNIRRIYSRV